MIEKFEVTLERKTYHYELELCKSGAQPYGNGMMVVVRCDGRTEQTLDVRYERTIHSDGSGFSQWAEEYMYNYLRKDCGVVHLESA